ncbi:preprotein translocase subunit YajC [bacterium]|nr:preprotein translocase subunit YajC [bacterium]
MNALHTLDALLGPLAASTPAQPNMLTSLMPLVLIFFVFYFLIIRPQGKRRRERVDMLTNLQKGNRVITTGGMIGAITTVRDKDVTIAVEGDGVKMKFRKSGIAYVLGEEDLS